MKLQTKLPGQPLKYPFSYTSEIVLLGSCFVENIGAKLQQYKFRALSNPFGIIFNPVSLEYLLERAVAERKFTAQDLVSDQGKYHCLHAHSKFSDGIASQVTERLNPALYELKHALKNGTHLVVTLGTAWVYEHKKSRMIVANCHKIPQGEFEKRLLTPSEITTSIHNLVGLARQLNPDLIFTFTVSPVRHLKDGFVENQLSKAHLITGLHELLAAEEQIKAQYFPSYELVMDELRDYRFYSEDMVHLNDLGVNYVWEYFKKAAFSLESLKTMEVVGKIVKGLSHRPFDKDSEAYLEFRNRLAQQIESIKAEYPFMNFSV